MSITFSTSWYNFKCKFPTDTYIKWIDNMLSNVNCYNLVIYSDEDSCTPLLQYLGNPRIKLIFKSIDEFYTYKYKDEWIKNHEKNDLLKERVDWQVNMLWSEKINFVHETITEKYFDTEYYGWCDIGYFRCTSRDLSKTELANWCSNKAISTLKENKIYYAVINNDDMYINSLFQLVNSKNEVGLPKVPIPPTQNSIAGGFFITHKENIKWWRDTYYSQLYNYFKHDYLVKDDQIVVLDCVLSNLSRFNLCKEKNPRYDNWFLFQRLLQ